MLIYKILLIGLLNHKKTDSKSKQLKMNNRISQTLALLCVFFLSMQMGNSQKVYFWLDAGLKVSAGSGMLYNNNLINDRNIDPSFGSTYGIGGKFGFNFGSYHAFTIDGMYSRIGQTNDIKPEGSDIITTKQLGWNSADIFFMYRYNRNLNYIELGAKYSLYQQRLESINQGTFVDVNDTYVDNMISPVLGFGYYMFNADAFTANLGFRLSYGIYDLLTASGIETQAFTAPRVYENYASTNPAFIELVLELNFGLGQYAKSVCGKRASFLGM